MSVNPPVWSFSLLPDQTDLRQDLFPINFPGQHRRGLWDHYSLLGVVASLLPLRDIYNDIGEEPDLVPDRAVVL